MAVLRYFKDNPKFNGSLIIAPLRVTHTVWPAEIKKWNQFNNLTYQILHGPGKEKKIALKADIFLLNVENIFWLFEHDFKYNFLVIDESSKFKSYGSKRFRILKKYIEKFERRVILTGTPAPSTLMDLYSQIYIVDKGTSLGKNITHYRNRYFYPVSYRNFIEWNLKSGSEKVIQNKITPIVKRIDAKTHLNLPPILYNNIEFELPVDAFGIYKQIEKRFFALIDGNQVLIKSAASAYNACRQIANGCLYEQKNFIIDKIKKRSVFKLHNAKIDAAREIIGELQGKSVLIAYHFKHDLDSLLAEFGTNTPYLGGGIDDKKSSRIITDWNSKKIPILLGHPQSMAHGLNLQHGGNDIIWFSLTDNLENYLQFNQRIYRQGVNDQVRIHHLIAKNTIDEAILKRLNKKEKSQSALLDAIKEYRNDHC